MEGGCFGDSLKVLGYHLVFADRFIEQHYNLSSKALLGLVQEPDGVTSAFTLIYCSDLDSLYQSSGLSCRLSTTSVMSETTSFSFVGLIHAIVSVGRWVIFAPPEELMAMLGMPRQ